jgi:hypothetical protein
MPATEKSLRQSVSLPARVARRVRAIAHAQHVSANHVLVDLIESGLEARDKERQRFLELADRLARVRDPEEQARIKEELAHMTFGD